jgi:rhodanese-related sulfurtransferase
MTRFKQLVDEAKSRVTQVSPDVASQQQVAGAVLIDVRETDDFNTSHAVGAIHLSRGVLELKIEDTVPDASTPIICYCGGSSRSALAAESLQKMGYTNVVSMESGFRGWKQAELPTE